MTWFKVDDDLAFHRKVVSAGNAAMGLWVRAGAWCAQHLTDGFVPDEMVAILGTTNQRAKLIKAGLWIEVDGGCLFHEWNENGRQPLAKKVRENRAAAAERQAKHRDTIYKNLQVKEASHAVTHTSVTEDVTPLITPAPTRPVPFSSSDEEENPPPVGGNAPNDLVGEWISGCRKRPPGAVVGQIAKAIKGMLSEGLDADDIRAGIQVWSAKGLHPSTLPSVVNEVMNARPSQELRLVSGGHPPAGTSSQRANAFLALRQGNS